MGRDDREGLGGEPGVRGRDPRVRARRVRERGDDEFFAELDGAPVATGSFAVHDDVALLAGASTVPSARNRGAQRALLAARLAEAKRRGCELAMMAAAPGSTSQRNAERNGFRVAYSRTKWRRA